MAQQLLFSIIIPTYSRLEPLSLLLESLIRQTPVLTGEILVIDNYEVPRNSVIHLCDEFNKISQCVKYLHQPISGASYARNMGIENANGEWLIFLDDDETVPDDYVNLVEQQINGSDIKTVFGGPYIPILSKPIPKWVKEEYYAINFGDQKRQLNSRESLLGGNLIISYQLIKEIGSFTTGIGPLKNQLRYGDDTELMQRAVRAGACQIYLPELKIFHHIPCERMTLKWWAKSKEAHGWSKALLYINDYQLEEDRFERLKTKLFFLRECLKKFGVVLIRWIMFPFRDRKSHPLFENYFVEVILPEFSQFRFFSTLFLLFPVK